MAYQAIVPVQLVARGDDQRTQDFADRAEIVAERGPGRRVIWLRDPQVLTADEETNWFGDDGGEAVIGAVLNNRDGRCGRILQRQPSRVSIDREGFLPCEKVIGLN